MEDSAPPLGVLGRLGRSLKLDEPLEAIFESLLVASARALSVSRVSLWFYDESRQNIRCYRSYSSSTLSFGSETPLRRRDYPTYFAALDQLRTVTAIDARSDPQTRELRYGYLDRYNIRTLLDVPILRSGGVVGVLCHEQTLSPRDFSEQERAFAASMGDMISLVIETKERMKLEAERAHLTQELGRLRELEGRGHFAAGVAHDLRNLLTVFLSGTALLRGRVSDATSRATLDQLDQASERARELCDMLFSFSGRSLGSRKSVAPDLIAAEMVQLWQRDSTKHPPIDLRIEGPVPMITADLHGLRRVLINLFGNASDATALDQSISVRVFACQSLADPLWDFSQGRSGFAVIEVRDAGIGMSEATLARAFDPFFSTKENGTGYGLASVLGIVKSHFGQLHVTSRLEQGSSFSVAFPVSADCQQRGQSDGVASRRCE